jgi:hypothetical protein
MDVRRPKLAREWELLALDALVTGVPMVTLRCHGVATAASFSPDGQRVVTASEDGTARVWPSSIPELQRLLREANADCLPPEARRVYLDETEAQAQERYEACERSYGRPPFFAATGAR